MGYRKEGAGKIKEGIPLFCNFIDVLNLLVPILRLLLIRFDTCLVTLEIPRKLLEIFCVACTYIHASVCLPWYIYLYLVVYMVSCTLLAERNLHL